MASVYLVAATGGLEDPNFESFIDEKEALATFHDWSVDCVNRPGDRVDILRLDEDGDMFVIAETLYDDEAPSNQTTYEHD